MDKVIITGGSAGSGGIIYGLTTGQIHTGLGIVSAVLGLVLMVFYIVFLISKHKDRIRVVEAELATEQEEKKAAILNQRVAKAQLENLQPPKK